MQHLVRSAALAALLTGCSGSLEDILGLQFVGAAPGVIRAGDTDVEWTVAGAGFESGTTVTTDAPGVAISDVTFVDANEITFRLSAPNTVDQGTASLTVTNPDSESRTRQVTTLPETVTLSGHVQPILDENCVGCHAGGAAAAGLDLSSTIAHGSIVGVASTQAPALDLVAAGEARSSYLVDKIAGTQAVGSRMPPNGGPLSTTEISVVVAWIEDGALDD